MSIQIRCQHRSGFELVVPCESLDQVDDILGKLVEEGYRPVPLQGDQAREDPGEARMSTGTKPSTTKAPSCPLGHGPMRPSKKFRGWYCPHREEEDGDFCSETVKTKK
jgi:hypothetical protein